MISKLPFAAWMHAFGPVEHGADLTAQNRNSVHSLAGSFPSPRHPAQPQPQHTSLAPHPPVWACIPGPLTSPFFLGSQPVEDPRPRDNEPDFVEPHHIASPAQAHSPYRHRRHRRPPLTRPHRARRPKSVPPSLAPPRTVHRSRSLSRPLLSKPTRLSLRLAMS
jgi:hypothetical protein